MNSRTDLHTSAQRVAGLTARRCLYALLVATAVWSAIPAHGAPPRQYGWRLPGEAFLRLGEGIETPHTKWMNPSALGTIKALILANREAAYDVPELARRLDLDVHGMPAETWLRLGDPYWLWLWIESSASSERVGHFERMLDEDCDVIVVGNYRFESFYETTKHKILSKVAKGCGLVLFYGHDKDPRLLQARQPGVAEQLCNGIPLAGLDFYRNLFMPAKDLLTPDRIAPELIGAYTFGQGRVIEVNYARQHSVFAAVPGSITPFFNYDYGAPVQYDYHQALAARCVMWAARRDPRFVWKSALPDGMEISAQTAWQPPVLEAVWAGDRPATLTRKVRVRNRWGDVLHESETAAEVRPGPVSCELSLPPLPGGWHFVDVFLSSEAGAENWGSFAVDVRPSIAIDAIDRVAGLHELSEDITGRVVLSRPSADGENALLNMQLEDGYGRLMSTAAVPVEQGADRVEFRIAQGNVVSWGARLRIQLTVNGQAVHQDEAELRIRRPDRGQYPIAMWGTIAGYGNHIGNLQMRNLGFTAVIGDPLSLARDDLGWMTFGGGRGALIHSLGDEIQVPRPAKGDKLGELLSKRYDSLDALNAAWGTTYASWAAVEPSYRATSGDAKSFIRMHDCLSAGEMLFAENARQRREAIEKDNPPGVVGPEGSPVGDPELTLPAVTFWGPYLTVRDNLLVSAIAKPGILRGNWFGGYVEDRRVETRNRHVLWMSILGGNNMIEYFVITSGLLAPDLTLMPFTQEFIPSWQQIRRGLGPQLAKCRPAGNPVALLHSQASQHVGQAGGDATDTIKVHEYMLNLLGDAGYSPQYVAAGQVRAGRLREGDVRVLMLLHAFALSDEEIAEIRSFVERGGVLLADIPPAWFDERCRLRDSRALDDVFGIAPAAPVASLDNRVEVMKHVEPVTLDGRTMLLRGHDSSLKTAAGSPVSSPLVTNRSAGKAILLNGTVWKEGREDPATIAAVQRLLADVAGTPRAFELQFRRPLGKVGTKVYSYRRGDIDIDAVLPPEATDPAIPVVPAISWPTPRHTYDLRNESYLGHVDHVEQEIERASPLVVARLDYKVAAVELAVPQQAPVGGTLDFTCRIMDADGKPRPGHVIRVAVFGPDGQERPHYGAWLSGDGTMQPWRIPFALNDPPGRWRITATDVISGTTGEAAFTLSDPTVRE